MDQWVDSIFLSVCILIDGWVEGSRAALVQLKRVRICDDCIFAMHDDSGLMVIVISIADYKKPKGTVRMFQFSFYSDLSFLSYPISVSHRKKRCLLEFLMLASQVFRVMDWFIHRERLVSRPIDADVEGFPLQFGGEDVAGSINIHTDK